MRLLNTLDLTFTDFYETKLPTYYILSHCWGADEVTYKDMLKQRAEGVGLKKIQSFIQVVNENRFSWNDDHWLWVDTCCIDRKSSAEISEAINSMWAWYANACECYVYLADVTKPDKTSFAKSRWFTRGWTLQELLAPNDITFFDMYWQKIGKKEDLAQQISSITGIMPNYDRSADKVSVAERLHWASKRETSRPEDIAYCLLGLFDVNMPLLYGEGAEKAFLRLQIEILKASTDDSIFTWKHPVWGMYCRLLAPLPDLFRQSTDLESGDLKTSISARWTTTAQGMKIRIPPAQWTQWHTQGVHFITAVLGSCMRESNGKFHRIALKFCHNPYGSNWHRSGSIELITEMQANEIARQNTEQRTIWVSLKDRW